MDEKGNPFFVENGKPITDELESDLNVLKFGFDQLMVKSLSPRWSFVYDLDGRQNMRFHYPFQRSFRPVLE